MRTHTDLIYYFVFGFKHVISSAEDEKLEEEMKLLPEALKALESISNVELDIDKDAELLRKINKTKQRLMEHYGSKAIRTASQTRSMTRNPSEDMRISNGGRKIQNTESH